MKVKKMLQLNTYYNKPEISGQTVCYKQEFIISGQFPMAYCSGHCFVVSCKNIVIEEFVIRVLHCISCGFMFSLM